MKKICKNCNIEKELNQFYLKSNGKIKSSNCKDCYNTKYKKPYDRKYYEENKEKFKQNHKNWCDKNDRTEYQSEYRKNNSEKIKLKSKEFRENNKELITQRKKEYYQSLTDEQKAEINQRKKENYYKNHDQVRETKNRKFNEKMKSDPLFKLSRNIKSLIYISLKKCKTVKSKKTIEILGCSFEEFKLHLESKFDDKMNWENQGSYWHLDHIIPISSAKTEEEVYSLNHYTNFQPLYWLDNLKKSNKILS